MTALREIVRTSGEYYNLHIPEEYRNKEVEIIILPHENGTKEKAQSEFDPKAFYGVAHATKEEIDTGVAQMRNEWNTPQ
jgi:hypothetical protein